MRPTKSEALDRMVFFGEDSLRRATHSFLDHYHRERNHQGLANKLIDPAEGVGHERLGGILRYYHRKAA